MSAGGVLRRGGVRFGALFAGWIVLGLTGPADLAVGAVAAALAAAASLRVLPATGPRPDAGALLRYAACFARGAVVAAVDVARRVFDPALPIAPGFVAVPCAIPPGTLRQGFRAATSLQPGTLPLGDDVAAMTLHCLDVHAPVARAIAADEARFRAAFDPGGRG